MWAVIGLGYSKSMFLPPQILNNENAWHLGDIYKSTHYYSRDNAFFADLGSNGTGKTFLALRCGELLGMNEKGEQTLFNPNYLWEHVCFEKTELMDIVNNLNKLPTYKARGYVIVVDEVQDALSSKESMQEEVRAISSYLATLRSRRYIIHFTLPSWSMLVKDARRVINYVNLMTRRPTNHSFSDLRVVKTNRMNDEPFLWRPRRVDKALDSFSGMTFYNRKKWTPLAWNLPSRKTLRVYRKLKAAAQIKKGQRIKERMEHAHGDSLNISAEEYEKWKGLVLNKVDSHERAEKLVRETKNGLFVNKAKVCALFHLDTRSPRFESTMKVLVEAYPHVFTGADW